MSISHLTDEELVRYCIGLPELTPLENELLQRLETRLDTEDEELDEDEDGRNP